MYEDIIDIKEENNNSTFYSKVTFCCGVFSLLLIMGLIIYVWYNKGHFVYAIVQSGFVLVICSTFVGLVAGFISFRFKESSTYFKWLGIIINFLVFIASVYLTFLA